MLLLMVMVIVYGDDDYRRGKSMVAISVDYTCSSMCLIIVSDGDGYRWRSYMVLLMVMGFDSLVIEDCW
jgi:hypothetical protein